MKITEVTVPKMPLSSQQHVNMKILLCELGHSSTRQLVGPGDENQALGKLR